MNQFLASKWLAFDLLVTKENMQALFTALGEPLFHVSTLGVAKKGEEKILQVRFLELWQHYLDGLQVGEPSDAASYRFFFTSCLTRTLDALEMMDVAGDRVIVSPKLPLLQMQMHSFHYSKEHKKFHSMSFGSESISWGVRISYPQLFQFPETRIVEDATNPERFVNAELLVRLKGWVRANTQPTPFLIEGKKVYEPMRIDKECLSWANSHAGLRAKGLMVAS